MDGPVGVGSAGGMGDMQASFEQFLRQPESQALVEHHQRKLAQRLAKRQEERRSKEFRAQVLNSGQESRKSIAPYLAIPALRRVISTFANDPSGQFANWSTNPEVLAMLDEAKRLIDEGRMTPEELDRNLLVNLQVKAAGNTDAQRQAVEDATVRLPMDQLVGALNEHLAERRKGNEKYKAGNLDGAMHHYERALAIVDYVRGMSAAEQAEVDANRVAVLLNIAAVAVEKAEFRTAAQLCSRALALDPGSRKALLRRAKAHMGRHEPQLVQQDLGAVLKLDPGNAEAVRLLEELQQTQQDAKAAEKQLAAGMLAGRQ